MRFQAFGLSFVACSVLALSAAAATVTMTATPNQNRSQTQGAGDYDVYDFFFTAADGAQFTNYTVTGNATTGSFFDPAKLQDDRQVNPAAAGQDGNTAGAVDMWANTVWSSAGKVDLGLISTILADPSGYQPTGSGAAPAFTSFKWDVFDNEQGDDNDLSDDPTNPTAVAAPYHIMRVVTSLGAVGTIQFLAFDTASGGTPSTFNFDIGDGGGGIAPTANDLSLLDLDTTVTPTATGTVTATGDTPINFGDLTFVSYTATNGGVDDGANGAGAALGTDGAFSFPIDGRARGEYRFTYSATNAFGSDTGNILVEIQAVPEPSTLALFGLAMVGGLGLIRRRNG